MKKRFGCILLMSALLAIGCGARDAGPSENERGFIFFWEVLSADLVWNECTDAEQFRAGIEAPEFEDNSFIVYRVSDDGLSLVDQQCEAVDSSTCNDSDLELIFEKSGDSFTFDEPMTEGDELAPGCRLTSDPLWELTDLGPELTLDVSLTFGLTGGDACTGVDENVARTGTNEFGIDGCSATIAVVADYYTRQKP